MLLSVQNLRAQRHWSHSLTAAGVLLAIAVAHGCAGRSRHTSEGDGSHSGGDAGLSMGGSLSGSGTAGVHSAGSAGTDESGAGGVAGASGVGGSGADAGTPPNMECVDHDDCRLVNDCCSCRAERVGTASEPCTEDCAEPACATEGIEATFALCLHGRCVLDRSCDRNRAICNEPQPECPTGELPAIVMGCWGPCVPALQCLDVTSCEDCGSDICVTTLGPGTTTTQCAVRWDECPVEGICGCPVICWNCTEGDNRARCEVRDF